MKTLRFILILTFLLTYAVNPAHAQTEGHFTYIALVTKADPNLPLRLQAQQAYETLLPQLIKAKAKGDILAFHPELNAGILEIEYATNQHSFEASNLTETDDLQAALAQVPTPTSSEVISEGGGISFELHLSESCFTIYGLPMNSIVAGTLYNKTGKLIGVSSRKTSSSKNYDCFKGSQLKLVMPGYQVIYKIYDATGTTLLTTFTTIAPSIEFTTINRSNSIVKGNGPAGKPYTIYWYHFTPQDIKSKYELITKSGTVSSQRAWGANLSKKTPMLGSDSLSITIQQTPRFTFSQSRTVPFMSCVQEDNHCWGYTNPDQNTTITLTHAGKTYAVTQNTDDSGFFSSNFLDAQFSPVAITSGDRINATNVPEFIIPKFTSKVNFSTDVISGVAPMNDHFTLTLSVYRPTDSFYDTAWISTHASKNYYAFDTTDLIDLKSNDVFVVYIYYVNPQTGNRTLFNIPFAP